MSKKPDTATALAGILKAKRGDDAPASPPEAGLRPVEAEAPPPPSPALPPAPLPAVTAKAQSTAEMRRRGKNSDPKYSQHSMYLPEGMHMRVKRRLEDLKTGKDVSDLAEELFEQWLKSTT